jgi:hypothetical protein
VPIDLASVLDEGALHPVGYPLLDIRVNVLLAFVAGDDA